MKAHYTSNVSGVILDGDTNSWWIGLRRTLDNTWFTNPTQNNWPMIHEHWVR